jgi:hypothetical protein
VPLNLEIHNTVGVLVFILAGTAMLSLTPSGTATDRDLRTQHRHMWIPWEQERPRLLQHENRADSRVNKVLACRQPPLSAGANTTGGVSVSGTRETEVP